jgi:uncharacterized protein YdhG (YjbR/CyaY superfamily)
MHSDATTVDEYLAALPGDRRSAIAEVRQVILDNLPDGIVETMSWGMICYEVPLATYPHTYNGKPLVFAGLASQKQHMAVYLTAVYGSDALRERFEEDYRATGKRLDMGKSCVRFKKLDTLPLDVIGRAVSAVTLAQFLAFYDKAASMRASKGSSKKARG